MYMLTRTEIRPTNYCIVFANKHLRVLYIHKNFYQNIYEYWNFENKDSKEKIAKLEVKGITYIPSLLPICRISKTLKIGPIVHQNGIEKISKL